MTYTVKNKKTGQTLGTVDEKGKQAYEADVITRGKYQFLPVAETSVKIATPPEAKKSGKANEEQA